MATKKQPVAKPSMKPAIRPRITTKFLLDRIEEVNKVLATQTEELEQQRVMIRDAQQQIGEFLQSKHQDASTTVNGNSTDWNEWFEKTNQAQTKKLTGAALSGKHYYRVEVPTPMSSELQPYRAECADIIEALDMTFNEGEAFKALWRGAATRMGNGKDGVTAEYNAEKAAHYGKRVEIQLKQKNGKN